MSVPRRDQAAFNRVYPGGSRQVAAVQVVIDFRGQDADLAEEIADVAVFAAWRAHDGSLAGQFVGSAQAIDLAAVGAAKDVEQ